jgi:tol-pal system protein YbgF
MQGNTLSGGAAGLCAVLLAAAGCAAHADFVELRGEVRNLSKTDTEHRKQQEVLQQRLQALETRVEAKSALTDQAMQDSETLQERIKDLTARLRQLDERLIRFESAQQLQKNQQGQAGPKVSEGLSETAPGSEPSRQSKPARLPSAQRPAVMPGTPGITPTSAFNLAYNDYLNGQYDLALAEFQQFLKDFPSTSLTPQVHYWIGETYYSKKEYERAIEAFQRMLNLDPKNEKVPPALFKIGLAAAELGDTRKARESLKQVIKKFSSSDEAKLAKIKLAELR